ncbi:molybdopterin guanine dinucleotide-containing S/N-oxide reductase [Paraburkholderia aspalathi]|nr:molybdopterin guanine dinucleotide-containing S/N-oxide reductase [Paraburkholderia aspalathi]MBK3843201.1 molybdopterin-dependent oxidoreductase [Paraburkholderia aspalathi]
MNEHTNETKSAVSGETRVPSLSHWGAFEAVVENGRLIRCEPFRKDPAPSRLLNSMVEQVYSPLRVLRPAVRRGWLAQREGSDRTARGVDGYVEVSWDAALQLVADELQRVRTQYGTESLFGGSYGWSSAGRLHHARTLTHRFLYSGGGCVDQQGNYSWGAAQFLLPHVIGTYAPVSGRVTDWNNIIGHTRLIIAFGGLALKNGEITSGGAGEHSMGKWLNEAVQAGVEFVSVSPTRADTPDTINAEWIGVRPNTDTAMMLAMAHTLLVEGLHDAAFLARYCEGFDAFADYLLGKPDGVVKSSRWAEALTGVSHDVISGLARRVAATRSMITVAWSLQRGHHGEQPYWMAVTLAAMLGQIGLPGGGFAFGHGSMNGVGNPRGNFPGPEMSPGKNPLGRGIPVARLTDMLLSPGASYEFNGRTQTYPDIQMVYWAGGNPFHHHQDLNRLMRAWAKPQTIVVHDSWWTPTARRADIVLPATTTLERNDIGGSSRDRFVLAMHQAIPPVGFARNDFDIYSELAARAEHEAVFSDGLDEQGWLRRIYQGIATGCAKQGMTVPDFDAFWQTGHLEYPAPKEDFVLFEGFRRDPDAYPLNTPSGKIEIFSRTIAGFGYDDCPPHPAWLPPHEWLGATESAQWPLHLVTNQPADKLHSQMDAGKVSLADKVSGRAPVRINPEDAAARGIRNGDIVRVYNTRGACLAGAIVDPGLMANVVVMPTGAWFDPQGPSLERHGNPNVLTLDIGTSRLAQAPSALSALVDVALWAGPAPDMKAHQRPEIMSYDACGEQC